MSEVIREQSTDQRIWGVVWFTGRPGAGKSTTARAVQDHLASLGLRVPVLDGDLTRQAIDPTLALSMAPRPYVAALHARLAHMLAIQELLVLVAAVSGYKQLKDIPESIAVPTVEVLLDVTPGEALRRRREQGREISADHGPTIDSFDRPSRPTLRRGEDFNPANPAAIADLTIEVLQHLSAASAHGRVTV